METDNIGREYYKIGDKVMAMIFIPRSVNRPGVIGGHCVMPNLDLLTNDADQLIKWIEDMSKYMELKESENE